MGIPTVREQELVVEFVSLATSGVCAAQEVAKQQIAAFSEYRARLIADVVTGKLDVREAGAGLPEVDPLAAEDDSDDGFDQDAGSKGTGWRHGVEEGSPLADVS